MTRMKATFTDEGGFLDKKISHTKSRVRYLAGETRFEHATYGFGDRYSTVEPLP